MPWRWQEVRTRGIRWQVQPWWLDKLLEAGGLRLREWEAEQRLRVIKDAPHRRVYRVELPEGAVYIKHYPVNDLRSRVRQWFRPTKARHEWLVAQAIAAQRLPTIEPLALGESERHESYLVTREFAAAPLDEFLTASMDRLRAEPALRYRLADQLAELLARLHDAGVEHADLHPGNLLAQGAPDDLRLALIDLYAAQIGEPLDWRRSARNLQLFGLWFWPRTTPRDRLRFAQSYLSARRCWPGAPPDEAALRHLEQSGWRYYLDQWRRRDPRAFRAHRDQRHLTGGQQELWAHRSVAASAAEAWLRDPDLPFSQPDVVLLKQSPTATVAEVDLPLEQGGVQRVIYKRFQQKQLWDPLVDVFRMTPAHRSWLNGWRLLDALLPTPRPLLLMQTEHYGLAGPAYLATAKLSGAVDLLEAYRRTVGPGRLRLIEQTARLIRRLHHHGLSHRDLKAANILATADPETGDWQLHFIDLVGVSRHERLGRRRRVRDLARLAVSFLAAAPRADQLRFLRSYLGRRCWCPERWQPWWRDIENVMNRKLSQNRRRGRPIS